MLTPSLAPSPSPLSSSGSSRLGGAVSGRPRTAAHARAEENSRLVWLVLARHFPFLHGDPDVQRDAYTAGYVELLGACERFDDSLGFTFATYAFRCIRGGVLRHLQEGRRQGRLETVSLEMPLSEDGGLLADLIADPQAEKPGAALAARSGFEARIAALPERQAALLRALYLDEQTPAEVAEAWGMSRQRVHQMHRRALQSARKAMMGGERAMRLRADGRRPQGAQEESEARLRRVLERFMGPSQTTVS